MVFHAARVSTPECFVARGLRTAYAITVPQRRLEARPVVLLGAFKMPPKGVIVFLLGAAQSDPPFFARGIDTLRTGVREHSSCLGGLVVIARFHENHRPPLLQSIL